MRGGLSEARDYALSDADIRKLLGDDIRIWTYPQLQYLPNADSLFDAKGRCILLFLTNSPTSGHWCCLLKKKEGIEFFDSYGEPPEAQLDEVPRDRLAQLDEDRPFLTRLLRASGRPVFYNTYPFQKERNDINTCGRHAVVRCLYAPNTLEQ